MANLGSYDAELEDLGLRRKYAELLRAQALQAPQSAGMAGRTVAPIHWTQALAGALKGVSGDLESQNVSRERKALGKRYETESSDRLQKAMMMMRGTQGTSETIMDETANGGEGQMAQINTPGKPSNRLGAALMLAESPKQMQQQMGYGMLGQEMNPELKTHVTDSRAVTTDPRGNVVRRTDFPPTQNQDRQDEMRRAEYARKIWEYQNLPEKDRARLEIDGKRLGMEGIDLWFRTGQRPDTQVNIPGNAPPPQMGQPSAPQAGPPQMGQSQGLPSFNQAMRQFPSGKPLTVQTDPNSPQPINQGVQRPQPQQPDAWSPGGNTQIPPKDRVKLELERPQAAQHAKTVQEMTANNLREIEKLEQNQSGVNAITGGILGRLPSVRGDPLNAQSALDTLKAQLGVQALNQMREASKTGGAVGQVTEREWPILQSQMGALQQAQTKESFYTALSAVKATLQRISQHSRDTYESTYGQLNWTPPQGTPRGETLGTGRRRYNPKTGRIEGG